MPQCQSTGRQNGRSAVRPEAPACLKRVTHQLGNRRRSTDQPPSRLALPRPTTGPRPWSAWGARLPHSNEQCLQPLRIERRPAGIVDVSAHPAIPRTHEPGVGMRRAMDRCTRQCLRRSISSEAHRGNRPLRTAIADDTGSRQAWRVQRCPAGIVDESIRPGTP